MNDKEFIQLLNLYLDHEISTTDAARLEAEVQSNPTRRHVYQQYCRMQKACRMIAADFQTEPSDAVVPAERKVVAFNPAVAQAVALRRKRATLYGAGSFAALAACVALVFVGRDQQPAIENETPAVSAPVAVAPASAIPNPDATFVVSKSATPRGLVSLAPRPQPMPVRDPLLLVGRAHAEAELTAFSHTNDQLAWIHAVKLAPLQLRTPADLHFKATLVTESRELGNRASAAKRNSQPADEYIGFQYGK